MVHLTEVQVGVLPLKRFAKVIGREQMREALKTGAKLRRRLAGRVVWNVNSTAVGGGVAELLQSLLCYARSVGIDARWVVIRGQLEFFKITKRLHHALHGATGDGTELGERERQIYEETLRENTLELASLVRPGDIVLLHDPQTAALAPELVRAGALVIWRCHIGYDTSNEETERGWAFLAPYLEDVPAFVFSRSAYVPEYCDHGKTTIIEPSIDAFSPKNQELPEAAVHTILVHTGLVDGPPPSPPDPSFTREDGSPGRGTRRAGVVRLGRAPSWDTPLIVQVSRWDPLKDPIGVMRGFAAWMQGDSRGSAELLLAGPEVSRVTDDPEGAIIFAQVEKAWRELPDAVRDRIHLVSLPTADVAENAAIVNALQRHATVVVQKSLREGFGLTVTEAMWKSRPLLASAVGGIQEQIEDGVSGILLKDPTNVEEFSHGLSRLLGDASYARRLGEAARERVRERYLGVRHLLAYARLIEALDR